MGKRTPQVIYNGKRYEAPIEDGHLNIKNILPTTI